jgi:signal transduction histidine kinase
MMNTLRDFFSNEGFMPHIHCYLDRTNLVWTMVLTDSLIGIAYVVISVTLYALVRKTKLPFHSVFLAFGIFILACGTTHFMEVYNLWVPNYWLSAGIKLVTATASVVTAIYLLNLFPRIVELTETAKELAQTKSKLEEFFLKKLSTPPEVKRLLARAVILPLTLAGGLIVISVIQVRYLRSVQYGVDHSDEVIRQGHKLEKFADDAETSLRGYWLGGLPELAESSLENQKNYGSTYLALESLVSDNDAQTEKLRNIHSIFQEWREFSRQSLSHGSTQSQRNQGFLSFYSKNSQFISRTTEAAENFLQVERDLRSGRSEKTKLLSSIFIFSVGAFSLLLGGIFAVFGRDAIFQITRIFGVALESEKQTQEKLRKSLTTRDEFLSIASHELKTPLTSLKLQLQMTKRWFRPEEASGVPFKKVEKMIDVSEIQVNRLQTLIDDLLDVSRIGTGKLEFRCEDVDVVHLVSEVVERYNEGLLATIPRVKLESPERLTAFCDRFRMEQVVTNLLSNAAKYGANKPIEIRVEKAQDRVRIIVRDEGMGIPKEKQEKIFERYERAVNSTNISGLGLGLYISREIVRAHYGTIRVESEPGHGSTFTVEFLLRSKELMQSVGGGGVFLGE